MPNTVVPNSLRKILITRNTRREQRCHRQCGLTAIRLNTNTFDYEIQAFVTASNSQSVYYLLADYSSSAVLATHALLCFVTVRTIVRCK